MDQIHKITFTWIDYTVFAVILGLNVLIGVYFGVWASKRQTKELYLLGGKNMTILPVATSLIASNFSGVALLAIPADIYMYGSSMFWVCVSFPVVCLIGCYVYLPVFFKLKSTSIYEYFNHRFNKKVRILASFLYVLSIFVYTPIVIYLPALAFAQVADISVYMVTPLICTVCICYTALGGLKAVIWTSALNFIGMLIAVVVMIVLGIESCNGIRNVWERAVIGGRLDIFEFRPTARDSFWSILIGSTFHYMCLAILNQGSMQKFLAIPTQHQARKSILIFCLGFVSIMLMTISVGVIAYANFWDCDPVSTKRIRRLDQLIPLLIMDVAGKIPGMPGIFIAGVFSASLSSLSAALNTIACTIYEDFLVLFIPADISESTINMILKVIVLVTGGISIALIFGLEQLGGVFELNVTVQAITNGPLLGLFTLGVLFPRANANATFYGGITGLIFVTWVVVGNQWYKSQSLIDEFAKVLSTEGCNFEFNSTVGSSDAEEKPFIMYRISIWYNTLMAATVVIITGLIISLFTKRENKSSDLNLFSPIIHCLIQRS